MSLIEQSKTHDHEWREAEWGFPKGRREVGESDYNCAIREFSEETGYPISSLIKIRNIVPFEEIFTGSNYKSYKHKYYLMYMHWEESQLEASSFVSNNEISCIEWKTYEQCMEAIRFYNIEKKELLACIDRCINGMKLFF